jgi:hypothetical protein
VGDRDGVLLAGPAHHLALEPVRALGRVGGDDHLDGPVQPQGVVERLERVGVAEVARRLQAGGPQRRERVGETLLGLLLGALQVGAHPVGEP